MANCPDSVTFTNPVNTPTAIYTINYLGYNIDNNCNTTYCYSVFVCGSPGLSHWVLGVLEMCQDLLQDKLISVTRNNVQLQENIGYELGTSDGVAGIKFEVGVEAAESTVTYCITLKGVYELTSVDVAVKGGPTPAQKKDEALCGPSCNIVKFIDIKSDLIESIALQEAGLAHIINAEGEKIQKAINIDGVSIDDLISLNKSISNTLTKVIKLEMVLEFKLEEINKLKCFNCTSC